MIKTISPYRTTVTCFHQKKQQEVVDTYDSSEYILSIASSSNNNISSSPQSSSSSNLVAAALSNQSIIIYDPNIGQIIQRIECAHDGPISEVQFFPSEYYTSNSNDQSLIISASQDGTIKIWNVQRQSSTATHPPNTAITTMKLELPNEQALSLSLGYGGTLAAVGTDKARISFFDLRRNNNNSNTSMPSGTLMGSYIDAHTEEVTKVQFQTIPTQTSSSSQATEMKTILASSSEDGLISIHDPSQSNEEDALLSILNINTPLRNIGFFGPRYEGIFALTGNESLSVHDWDSAQLVSNVHGMELRSVLCSAVDSLVGKKNDMSSSSDATMSDGTNNTIDYLIGCTWSDLSSSTSSVASSPALYLLAGNNQGDGYIFRMDVNQITPVIHLKGGHRGCIRDFCWSSNRLITGGEDARLCEWDLTGSSNSMSTSNVGGTSGWNRSNNDSVGGGPVSGRSAVKGMSKDGKKKKKFGSPY